MGAVVVLLTEAMAAAFWSRVDVGRRDVCWLFLGGRTHGGYGALNRNVWGESVAHRLAWRLASKNRIPEGMQICHHCDNPPCVNPSHLFLGTPKDNMQDRNAKGRAASKIGELNGRARLTAEDVAYIRRVYRPGHKSRQGDPRAIPALARRFGVSQSAVRLAVQGKHWRVQ
jgi:hypothetical protein